MSFLLMFIFMIPLCFKKKLYWMIQMILFFSMFMYMLSNINLYIYKLSYMFGVDMISYGLILLSIWICVLMVMASSSYYKMNYYYNLFLFNVMMLLIMLYLTFFSLNLFMFYLFFEGSLIPLIFLILGWGYQSDRVQAVIYLLFYTLFASLPMLLGIIFIYNNEMSLMIYFLKFFDYNLMLLYYSMVFSFLVKMPMYFFHLWLPKAHVEAPVSGSMILAGIMLKLGGYGLMRIMIFMQFIVMKINLYFIMFSLLGGVLVSLLTFCQTDMKSLIAYSSVVHMSMVIGGIMVMNYWGFMGSYILMIGHGLCSSGLFFLVNVNYERLLSRSLYINKGLLNYMPSMSLWWFVLVSCNMAAPPSLNLMGEVSLIMSLISWSEFTLLLLMMISFFSAVYSLYLYSFSQHGYFYMMFYSFMMGVSREFLILFLHWVPLNFIILKIDYLIV